MSQENQGSTATPLTGETGRVIPLPPYRHSRTESQTQLDIETTTYIPATDLDKRQAQEWPRRRVSGGMSFRALTPPDRSILDLAFGRISQVLQRDFQMAELSNCFDEWKDFLETASRKVESFTSNHRKILGTLLSLVGGKDISDFDTEILRTFRDATNVLRMPRTSKQDARRIILELLKRKKNIMVPLGIEESAKDKVQVLDNIIDRLILKSRSDQ
jgi:hypothetical protein